MEESASRSSTTSRHLIYRLLTIAENRLALLTLELQEERERLIHSLLLALGVVTFGLLAAMTLTAAVVVAFWDYSPVAVLLSLTLLYGIVGGILYRRLTCLLQDREALANTFNQLRKDREALEKIFG